MVRLECLTCELRDQRMFDYLETATVKTEDFSMQTLEI